MHCLGHLQVDLGVRQLDPTNFVQTIPHQECRSGCPCGVARAVEPQQQRIASELQQAGAVFVGDAQDRLETAAHHVGDLLGAFAAFSSELLGELREPRNVDECRRALFGPPAPFWIVGEMLVQCPGYVGLQTFDARAGDNRRRRDGRTGLRRGRIDDCAHGVVDIASARAWQKH